MQNDDLTKKAEHDKSNHQEQIGALNKVQILI